MTKQIFIHECWMVCFFFFSVYECQKSPAFHAKTAQYHITQQIWCIHLFSSYRCINLFFSYTNVEWFVFFFFPCTNVKRALRLVPKQPNITSRSEYAVFISFVRIDARFIFFVYECRILFFLFSPAYECQKSPVFHAKKAQCHITGQVWCIDLNVFVNGMRMFFFSFFSRIQM